MLRRVATAAALALIACGLLATAAAPLAEADALSRVQAVYSRTGQIPACTFSSRTLATALKEAPTYDTEYSGITQAIDNALATRAAGACGTRPRSVAAGGGTVPSSLRGVRAPASVTASSAGSAPAPVIVLLALAAAAAAAAIATGVARARGWDPRWARVTRHAFGEAEFRLGLDWDDLRDWLGELRRR